MKPAFPFLLSLLLGAQAATAQISHETAEARTLYQDANGGTANRALRASLRQNERSFLGDGRFEFGALRTIDGRRRRVPGLRYHAGLRLLEVQDSLNPDTTHLWPEGSLRGFDLGEADDPDMPLRRFRTRLVKEGSAGVRRESVEVLTAIDAGPLLLAWLYAAGTPEGGAGGKPLVGILVAGAGTAGAEPLRPLEASESAVLHLFGSRSRAMREYAESKHLDYSRPADIARLMDYYNRVAVVK